MNSKYENGSTQQPRNTSSGASTAIGTTDLKHASMLYTVGETSMGRQQPPASASMKGMGMSSGAA